jgi:hypothetical protein
VPCRFIKALLRFFRGLGKFFRDSQQKLPGPFFFINGSVVWLRLVEISKRELNVPGFMLDALKGFITDVSFREM